MSRTSMRDLVAIGQTWRRRRDGQLARQVHRPDRLAELELTDPAAATAQRAARRVQRPAHEVAAR